MEICKLTAREISDYIKNREFTCTDAVNSFFDRIDRNDGQINAYITACREQALEKAHEIQKKIEKGLIDSPIAGVPVAIKDNICTKGIKTTCASKMLESFEPIYNASAVERLEKAGAIIIGKLNMDEFAMGSTGETSYFGAVKNPFDITKSAGGSSSGAAAAVSFCEAACALGSDTGGSIRQPAAHCGVTGFKPTYGTVSRYGLTAYASSMDTIGPIAKNAADCAAVFDVICGKDSLDGTSVDIKKNSGSIKKIQELHIAVPAKCFCDGTDEDVAKAVLNAADVFKAFGAAVEEIDLPFIKYVVPAYYILACAEASSNLARFDGVKYGFRCKDASSLNGLYEKTRAEGFGKEVKKRILLGTFVLSAGYYDAYYKKALQVKSYIKQQLDEIYKEYDLILMPCAPHTAPKLGESLNNALQMYLSDIFTVTANLAGLPAISVPCGFDRSGMPIGLQLIGQRMNDYTVLNTAQAYQQVTDWHKIRAEVR